MTRTDLRLFRDMEEQTHDLRRILSEMELRRDSGHWTDAMRWLYESRKKDYAIFKKKASIVLEDIEMVLITLPPEAADLLRMRYVCGLSWKVISQKMGYSVDHVSGKLHRKALELFEENSKRTDREQ